MALFRSSAQILAIMVLAACGKSPAPVNVMNSADNAAVNVTDIHEDGDAASSGNVTGFSATDGWAGRWTGPEGLFLDIKPAEDGTPGHYALTVKDNLDTQADYTGTAVGETIHFARAGKDETIRAGKGVDTGFKWLADKEDCLIVVTGKEGYCR